jgi:predicted pyridoxine 5'-phosphate oxidase superfamily flavin-nucleotide-binding protein
VILASLAHCIGNRLSSVYYGRIEFGRRKIERALIEHHQIWLVTADDVQGFFTIIRREYGEPGLLPRRLHQPDNLTVIIDDGHALEYGRIIA